MDCHVAARLAMTRWEALPRHRSLAYADSIYDCVDTYPGERRAAAKKIPVFPKKQFRFVPSRLIYEVREGRIRESLLSAKTQPVRFGRCGHPAIHPSIEQFNLM
jgi:hypothetical protein